MTALDDVHAAMQAAPDDDAARMDFYDGLAATELYLLLEREARDEHVEPRLFETSDGTLALAFDLPERLTAFAGTGPAPYAALSGRLLARMLGEAGIGLALNPDGAASSAVLGPDALTWLVETLAPAPEEAEARPVEVAPPGDLPERLLTALDRRLAASAGLARMAYLAGVTYDSGIRTHLLAFIGATEGAESALARAAREALVFSGLEAGALDVAFFAASDPLAARLARVGLRFDLPVPEPVAAPQAPGTDPGKPPRLR